MPERFSYWRSFLIGSILCCLVPIMAHLSIHIVRASWLAIDFMPVVAIFLLFILALGNMLLRAASRRYALTQPELLVIYCMLIVCASITTMGLGAQLLPMLGAPQHYATPENRWASLVLPHIPKWLMPAPEVIRGFFRGLEAGESIPWAAWIRPLAAWLLFLIPAYYVMVAVTVILRKQWVDHEHLAFPLTALPRAICEPAKGRGIIGPFFKNPYMWLAFSAVFLVASMNAMHNYWDGFPGAALGDSVSIFRKTTLLHFTISFPILGFAFLVNRDLLFSLWFFNLIFLCIGGVFRVNGIRLNDNLGIYGSASQPIFAYLGMGAMSAIAFLCLYNARAHLRDVLKRAIGRGNKEYDSGEMLSYRTAVWGIAISLIIMWVWLSVAGLNPLIAPLYLFLAYILFLALTRIVCEGGLTTIVASMIAPVLVVSLLGVNLVGAGGLAILALMYTWSADLRIFPMAECAHGLALVPTAQQKRLLGPIVGALVISFILSTGICLWLAYRYGGVTLNRWFFVDGPQMPFRLMAEKVQNPMGPSWAGYSLIILGALITLGLSALRAYFYWFTLHPIGFAVGSVWLMHSLWFSIFLAWVAKSFILWYAGPAIYKRAIPVFLGFPLGQYAAAGVWFLIDLYTGKTGNCLFWI